MDRGPYGDSTSARQKPAFWRKRSGGGSAVSDWELQQHTAASDTSLRETARGCPEQREHVCDDLEEIEAINWARPAVCCERACDNILPEGYGFRVRGITYDSGARAFTVTFQVMEQYLGDVTGYQAQVEAARAETEQVRQEARAAEEAALAETERLRREMEALEAQAAEAAFDKARRGVV